MKAKPQRKMENQQQPENKPVLIPTAVAAKILTLSAEHVSRMCPRGEFKTAVQPGGPGGNYRIDRNEVVARIQKK